MNLAVELNPPLWMIIDPLLLHVIGFGVAGVPGTVLFPGFVAFVVVFVLGGVFVEVDRLGVALRFSTSTFGVRISFTYNSKYCILL